MKTSKIEELNTLQGDWENIDRIIPYGYGADAIRTLKRIVEDFDVPFIVDQDAQKWGQNFMGVEIVSPDRLSQLRPSDKVVITVAKRRYPEIKQCLDQYGLKENQNYCHLGRFAVEWYYRYRNEYCLFTLDIALTTACTLNCKNCNMFIPYYKKPFMGAFETMKRSIDLLFQRIDYIFTIGLLGGEALLNPDLIKILEYMRLVYSKKFGQVSVITNGVVIPDQTMLRKLKRENIVMAISDYSHAIGARSSVDELVKRLREEKIPVNVLYNRSWCSFGFPDHPKNISGDQVREHMLQCDPGWRGLNDGRLYYCNVAWSADKAGLFKLQPDDYIELSDLPVGDEDTKRIILEYSLGKMPKGYLSFCKFCGGCGPDNQEFVLAGQQI